MNPPVQPNEGRRWTLRRKEDCRGNEYVEAENCEIEWGESIEAVPESLLIQERQQANQLERRAKTERLRGNKQLNRRLTAEQELSAERQRVEELTRELDRHVTARTVQFDRAEVAEKRIGELGGLLTWIDGLPPVSLDELGATLDEIIRRVRALQPRSEGKA